MRHSEKDTAAQPPGRVCPLRYRYGAEAIASAETRAAQTLYVVGGLYGNLPALEAVEQLAGAEREPVRLCFNGDFNWFNIDDTQFEAINRRVLRHDAMLGNVEAEFGADADDAGCGCAYPEHVDAGVVERSNRIHATLKATARRHPQLAEAIARLPMYASFQVGDCRIAVVHGDADSLAGWRFDVEALDDCGAATWLAGVFARAQVDVFASTHTCLPAMRAFPRPDRPVGWIVNNGACGMPNFNAELSGLCTRIALTPSPHPVVHEVRRGDVWLGVLPIRFDVRRWHAEFLAQWPEDSAAWTSYWHRISRGPDFTPDRMAPKAG